jgi:hypothetical protein
MHIQLTEQETAGLTLMAKRSAHAAYYGLSIEESQRAIPITQILHDPLFTAVNCHSQSANGQNADSR